MPVAFSSLHASTQAALRLGTFAPVRVKPGDAFRREVEIEAVFWDS